MNVSPSTVFVKKHGGPILGRRMEQWSNTSDADYLPSAAIPAKTERSHRRILRIHE